MYTIYCHQNKINGKLYFGITTNDMDYRANNGHGYITNKTFYKDICLYGWEGFIHKTLSVTNDELCARAIENYLIIVSSSLRDDLGYNRVLNRQVPEIYYQTLRICDMPNIDEEIRFREKQLRDA